MKKRINYQKGTVYSSYIFKGLWVLTFILSNHVYGDVIHMNLKNKRQAVSPIGFSSYIMPQTANKEKVFEILNIHNPAIVDMMDSVGFVQWKLPTKENQTADCLAGVNNFTNYYHCIYAYFDAHYQKPYPNWWYQGKLKDLANFAKAVKARNAILAYGIMNVPIGFRPHGDIYANGLTSPKNYGTWLAARVKVVQNELDKYGIKIKYVDMSNEPDYVNTIPGSSGYISPEQYGLLAKQFRKALDTHGLADIKISGPNLSRMTGAPTVENSASSYIERMKNNADFIDEFSFHAWWNDAVLPKGAWPPKAGTGKVAWTKQIEAIKHKYPNKLFTVTEFATLQDKDNDKTQGYAPWVYPIDLKKAPFGEKPKAICHDQYHYPNWAGDPKRECPLTDLVSWGNSGK